MRTVPFVRWGISKENLREIRAQVKAAVKNGTIAPTETDQFDPHDERIGPNIHTVNEYFIKPITRDAGGMSMALMMNPEGVACDLFVTHAWQEGFYEFADKLLNAWPWGVHYVYACMFSNPQNLDIGELISHPRESPFAKCLEASKYMIVIPNAKGSIYSRLWCVYEIHIAVELGKPVIIAKRAKVTDMVILAIPVVLSFIISGALAKYVIAGKDMDSILIPFACPMACAACSFLLRSMPSKLSLTNPILTFVASIMRRFCAWLGASCCGAVMFLANGNLFIQSKYTLVFYAPEFALLFGVIFVLQEIDRVREDELQHEENELLKGYAGNIMRSTCASREDESRIWQDIDDNIPQVEHAIQVLIASGMSTPALMQAAQEGLDIRSAGHLYYATLFAFFIIWFATGSLMCWQNLFVQLPTMLANGQYTIVTYGRYNDGYCAAGTVTVNSHFFWIIGVVHAAFPLFFLVSYALMPYENRSFAVSSLGNFVLLLMLPIPCDFLQSVCFQPRWGSPLDVFIECLDNWSYHPARCAWFLLMSVLIVCTSAAGLGRTLKVPYVGPALAQFCISGFNRAFFEVLFRRGRSWHTTEALAEEQQKAFDESGFTLHSRYA